MRNIKLESGKPARRTLPREESSEERERIWWGEDCLRKRNVIETSFLEIKEFRIINREGGMIKYKTSWNNRTQSSLFAETNTRIKKKVLVNLSWIRRKACTQSLTHSFIYSFMHSFFHARCMHCMVFFLYLPWTVVKAKEKMDSWTHPVAPDA